MNLNKLIKSLAAMGLSIILFASCSKEPLSQLSVDDTRIYTTNNDPTADFSSFKTFSVSDSAIVINNGEYYKSQIDIDQAYINAVKNYMQQRGYTLVSNTDNPDIGINVTKIFSTTTGVIDNTDYWDYYGGYWDPYYWGYGGYGYGDPYGYGVYSVTQGAVSIDMLDLKNAATKGSIDVIWTGLIRGEGIFNTINADPGVKALFDQSTYIQAL